MLIPIDLLEKTKEGYTLKKVKVETMHPSFFTVYILQDDKCYMAKCIELDLVTEMNTREKSLDALMEMMMEYAQDYTMRLSVFSKSKNRAHHRPYIETISRCKTKWDLLELVNVKYGHIQLQSAA